MGRQGCLVRADAWPFLGSVNQIGGGGVGVSEDHLLEDVVRFDELNDRGRVRGPEVFEAADVGILAAGEQARKCSANTGTLPNGSWIPA